MKVSNKRWYIKYAWKDGRTGIPGDWKSWRSFAVVPILFHSKEDAEAYFAKTRFKNMKHLGTIISGIYTKEIVQ